MDQLKLLLQNKQSQNSYFKKSDILKKEQQEYKEKCLQREKEKQEKELKNIQEYEQSFSSQEIKKKIKIDKKEKAQKNLPFEQKDLQSDEDDQNQDNIIIPKIEIIRILRSMNQPITLFGESEIERYKRFNLIAQDYFGENLKENKQLDKENFEEEYLIEILEEGDEELINKYQDKVDPTKVDEEEIKRKVRPPKKGEIITIDAKMYKSCIYSDVKNIYQVKIIYQKKCLEIYVWIKKNLIYWDRCLQQKTQNERNQFSYKKETLQYRWCRRSIKPLQDLLKQMTITMDILNGLYISLNYCLLKEYVIADNKYLELAIGNAAWPMGVTMVGIHERAGRSKIYTSTVAHILNDETTRKYLQAYKRIMTISQFMHPNNDLTKMCAVNY